MEKTGKNQVNPIKLLLCVSVFCGVTESQRCGRPLYGSTGTFTSPGYPGRYTADSTQCTDTRYGNPGCRTHLFCVSHCEWNIITDEYKYIRLTFSNFHFPLETTCCPSHVEVWEGSDSTGTRLGGLCDTKIPDPITSTGHQLHIIMAATSTSTGVSFEASWTTACQTKMLESENGTITSPKFPQLFGEIGECKWIVSVQPDHVIELTFHTFEVGQQQGLFLSCDHEMISAQVILYDSYTAEPASKIQSYCTRENPGTISTSGNHLTIIFKSRAQSPQDRFKATYDSKHKSRVIKEQSGLFSFGRFRDDYALKANAEKSICIALGEQGNSDNFFGMPVGDEYPQYAQVHANGKVAFHSSKDCALPERGYVCVYCTDIKNAEVTHLTGILFKNYTRGTCKDLFADSESPCEKADRELTEYTGQAFRSEIVLVVMWDDVEHSSNAYSGRATFQAAIISDGYTTYALTYYQNGNMNWSTTRTPEITVEVGTILNRTIVNIGLEYSKTRNVLRLDVFPGNTGRRGTWMYKLGSLQRDPDTECHKWYWSNNDQQLKETRKQGFARLPSCPCRFDFIRAHSDWVRSPLDDRPRHSCFRLAKRRSRDFFPYGKVCCYEGNHSFSPDIPDAGSATAYNPSFPSLAVYNEREDRHAYDVCCRQTSGGTNCGKYYELREKSTCDDVSKRFSWMCCDPYIVTLDEKGYLFNGFGEYTMMALSTSSVDFTLQCRTDRPEKDNAELANGTVYTAFGAEENGVKVFVGLDPGNKSLLIIYANGTDYSLQFRNTPDFLVDTDDFILSKYDEDLTVAFSSGISFTVSVKVRSLAISLGVPLTFQNQTRGLLGNFNGNQDDEFILPDGTMLRSDLTEREIFEHFGQQWKVTEVNSIMLYGPREGPADFDHPEFTPAFLDEQPSAVRQEAEGDCGSSNTACINDYLATGSAGFALNSKQFTEEAERTNEIAKNTVPQLEVPLRLDVTSGSMTTFTLQGFDVNDVLAYNTVDDDNNMVQVDSSTGHVTYTPDSSRPTTLSFYAVDSHNVQSPIRVVPVVICSGCNGHGTCDFSKYSYGESGHYNFQFALCVCEPAWDGPHCEQDRDGCFGRPCMLQQNCTDLTPQQQGQSHVGFDCGPCPLGFTKVQGSENCLDIDECAAASTNDCDPNSYCYNTRGSYQCECHAGYRSDDNGRTCWDIDECQEKTDNCQQICNNTAGHYTCLCEEGFTLDGSGTTCSQDSSTASMCSTTGCSQGCKSVRDPTTGNTVPECFCFSGYDLDPTDRKTCRDHDECEDGICDQNCFNYDGGFVCLCESGYRLSEDKSTCEPCPPLRYGRGCELTCTCSGRFQGCHPVMGCICEEGWTGSLCQDDVDECLKNRTICSNDQICVNTPGSYECNCQDGYQKDARGTCEDVDECGEGSPLNTCGELAQCVNVPGGFHCTCSEGYHENNGECEDVDECADGKHECEQRCHNVLGTYNCDCNYGYRLRTDRVSCTNVSDVCAEFEGLNCDHGCTLSDTDNSAVCFCRAGYRLADQESCEDIDECAPGTSVCSHRCSNTDGGFLCSCPPGMKLDNDGKTCLDCPTGTYGADCAPCACGLGSQRCDVTTGCVCKEGWQGEKCADDINECDRTNVQQECREKNAQCENYPGGYRCRCGDGYQENSAGVCEDIDECSTNLCDQQCENSPGSYSCMCNRGFTLDSETRLCKDIDECLLSVFNNCTQRCINSAGSYKCTCDKSGYVIDSDGVTCIATGECVKTDCPTENGGCSNEQCFCNSGYELATNNTCVLAKVDWCDVAKCHHICQETTDGDSICSCRPGFRLQKDERSCLECPRGRYGDECSKVCTCTMQNTRSCDKETGACTCMAGWEGSTCSDDTDECAAPSDVACPDNAQCENTEGSYRCVCDEGYVMGSSGNCIVPGCTGDKCPQQCSCSENAETCHNATGACICKQGWEGARCENDTNECMTGRHDCRGSHSLCVNKIGSYECACEQGFTMVESVGCVALGQVKVRFTITDISVTSDDISDATSTSFSLWAGAASDALDKKLRPKVNGFRSVNIMELRVGSLIVETGIVLDQESHPDAIQTLSLALLDLAGDSLTVNGQTGNVQVSINDEDVDAAWTPCDLYTAIRPCSDKEECVLTGQLPECRHVEPASSSKDNTLIIALATFFALIIVIVLIVIIVKCCLKKKKRPVSTVDSYAQEDPGAKPESSGSNANIWVTNQAPEANYAPLSTMFGRPRQGSVNILDNFPRPLYEMTEHPYDKLDVSEERPVSRPGSAASYLSVNGWTDGEFSFDEPSAEGTYQNSGRWQ